MRDLTRDDVVAELSELDMDWGDEEDAQVLVDLLLLDCTPVGAMIWLCFWDADLDGIPLELLERGRGRDVLQAARSLVRVHA